MQRNVPTAALACVVAAAVLTGCGGSKHKAAGPGTGTPAPAHSTTAASTAAPASTTALAGLTARQISDRAVAAMKALTAVTAETNGTEDGQKVRMKTVLMADGKCVSHATIGGGNLDLISTGTDSYVKGDKDFWAVVEGAARGAAIDAKLKGRWMKMAAGFGGDDTFKSLCDLKTVMDNLTTSSTQQKKGAPTVVAGRETIPVSGPDDDGTTTVYVAARGTPYVLKAVRTGSQTGVMVFSGFDRPVPAIAPAASRTLGTNLLA